MADNGSVTRWFDQLQAGDPAAAERLWQRYFQRLVDLARLKLRHRPRQAVDEEDVALSAFACFCRNAERGRFPQLSDRDNLWRLLIVITVRKAHHVLRDENRQKRGGGARIVSDTSGDSNEELVLEHILSREPTPDVVAQMAEEYHRRLRSLGNRELEAIALLRLEGYSVKEIADRLGCVTRTVKRKLHRIRGIWE